MGGTLAGEERLAPLGIDPVAFAALVVPTDAAVRGPAGAMADEVRGVMPTPASALAGSRQAPAPVFDRGYRLEMAWVDTGWSPTEMVDHGADWQLPDMHLVAQTMSQPDTFGELDPAVAHRTLASHPEPTAVGLLDEPPEPLFGWRVASGHEVIVPS